MIQQFHALLRLMMEVYFQSPSPVSALSLLKKVIKKNLIKGRALILTLSIKKNRFIKTKYTAL